MVAQNPLSQGADYGAPNTDEFELLAELAGDDLSKAILMRLYQRSQAPCETTIRDLHQFLDRPLQDVFAALRALESGKIIDILDNPSDPFGAMMHLRKSGLEILRHRRVSLNKD